MKLWFSRRSPHIIATQLSYGESEMAAISDSIELKVSVDEIGQDLPTYLRHVEAGKTLIIMRNDRPIA
jgi:hypothetical protein